MSGQQYNASDISSVEVIAYAKVTSFSLMECVIRDCNGKPFDLKYIKSSDLKEEGVIKRYDATQKAERWLNTEEGKRWIASATDYKDVLIDKIKTLHDNFSNQRETRY